MQNRRLGRAPVTSNRSVFEVSAGDWGRRLACYAVRPVLFSAHPVASSLIVAFVLFAAGMAHARPLLVAGSPGYDAATGTGLISDDGTASAVNNSGIAVGYATRYVAGTAGGSRAVRWGGPSGIAEELSVSNTSQNASSKAYAINDAGVAVGFGGGLGAVRWEMPSTIGTAMGNLGTSSNGSTSACSYAINNTGTAVGYADVWDNPNRNEAAVRWDPPGAVATQLDLSVSTTAGCAWDINDAGTIVGNAWHDVVGQLAKGSRAVRWNANSTVTTELGHIGTTPGGYTEACAGAVNATGTAVGWANKYLNHYVNGQFKSDFVGNRPVRWDANSTAATKLDDLGTNFFGETYARAIDVNAIGTAVGWADKYVSNAAKGTRAVRWDAGGTAVTELPTLGTDANGSTLSFAYAINDAGTVVGTAQKYVNGSSADYHAVIWLPDTTVIDLNDLGIASTSDGGTWTLITATAMSTDGWVAGKAEFDPDGAGPLARYRRLWVAQIGLGGTWTNAAGGTWGRGPNWSTGTPAMQVGSAVFNLASTYTVALDRDELTKAMAIDAGTLAIAFNGHTLTTESGLSIANGAMLKGAGTIVGDISNAGTIAPGNSAGTLNLTGNLVNTGRLEFEIASLLSHDEIDLTGIFNAGGLITVTLDGYTPMAGSTFDLMDFAGFVNNGYTFDFSHATLSAGLEWDTTSFATTGIIGVVGVPEPSSLALFGIATISLLTYSSRRRNRIGG